MKYEGELRKLSKTSHLIKMPKTRPWLYLVSDFFFSCMATVKPTRQQQNFRSICRRQSAGQCSWRGGPGPGAGSVSRVLRAATAAISRVHGSRADPGSANAATWLSRPVRKPSLEEVSNAYFDISYPSFFRTLLVLRLLSKPQIASYLHCVTARKIGSKPLHLRVSSGNLRQLVPVTEIMTLCK